jgi:hypothetical protein
MECLTSIKHPSYHLEHASSSMKNHPNIAPGHPIAKKDGTSDMPPDTIGATRCMSPPQHWHKSPTQSNYFLGHSKCPKRQQPMQPSSLPKTSSMHCRTQYPSLHLQHLDQHNSMHYANWPIFLTMPSKIHHHLPTFLLVDAGIATYLARRFTTEIHVATINHGRSFHCFPWRPGPGWEYSHNNLTQHKL